MSEGEKDDFVRVHPHHFGGEKISLTGESGGEENGKLLPQNEKKLGVQGGMGKREAGAVRTQRENSLSRVRSRGIV